MISTIFAVVLVAFTLGSAHPMEKQQADGPWSLFAYGNNIDGLPILYADGKHISPLNGSPLIIFRTGQAQVGMALSNATNKFAVSCGS